MDFLRGEKRRRWSESAGGVDGLRGSGAEVVGRVSSSLPSPFFPTETSDIRVIALEPMGVSIISISSA